MSKQFKYQQPKMGQGIVPAIFLTKESVRLANELDKEIPKRIERGMQLFLLASAKILREAVAAKAPTIPSVGYYAEDLEVVLVEGVPSEEAVALLYKNKPRKLNIELDGRKTALLFIPRERSPKWVRVLGRYQPWPSYMVPTMPTSADAQVIARQITAREDQDLRDKIMNNRRRIEFELSDAGLRQSKIKTTTTPSDSVDVVDDIGYAVLRAEFGYGGPATPHWRPAMSLLAGQYRELKEAYVKFVLTGNENVFDLPSYKTVASGEVARYDDAVQDKLAPYAKGD
jgi:hypothetical protein